MNNQEAMKENGIVKVSREFVPIKHMTISEDQVAWAKKEMEKVARIENLAFVGMTSEPFAEFGMDIKSKSPCSNTMVMGYTNDDVCYFPTQDSYEDGPKGFTPMISGYETTPGTSRYEIGSGEILADSAVRQLEMHFN